MHTRISSPAACRDPPSSAVHSANWCSQWLHFSSCLRSLQAGHLDRVPPLHENGLLDAPLRRAVAGRGECAVGDGSNQTYREAAADSRLFERMPRGVSAVRGPVDQVGGLEHQPQGCFGGILGRLPGAFSSRVQLWRTRSKAQKALSYAGFGTKPTRGLEPRTPSLPW